MRWFRSTALFSHIEVWRKGSICSHLPSPLSLARHFVNLIEREDHHLAILADQCDELPLHDRERPRGIRRDDVEHLLTLTSVGEAFVLWNNEAAPLCACNNEFAPTLMAESSYEIGLLLQVYDQPDRLTMAVPRGK